MKKENNDIKVNKENNENNDIKAGNCAKASNSIKVNNGIKATDSFKELCPLKKVTSAAISGNKAFQISQLMNKEICVPDGFVINIGAFYHFLEYNGWKYGQINTKNIHNSKLYDELFNILNNGKWDKVQYDELKKYYDAVKKPVCVRSSGICEDGGACSMAGFYTSSINVRNFGEFLLAVKETWRSAFQKSIVEMTKMTDIEITELAISLLVQELRYSVAAGVAVINDDKVIISASYGLGIGIVSGNVPSDQFVCDLTTNDWHMAIADKNVCYMPFSYEQHGILRYNKRLYFPWKDNREIEMAYLESNNAMSVIRAKIIDARKNGITKAACLDEGELNTLKELLLNVRDNVSMKNLDVEWCQDESDRFHILQVRELLALTSSKKMDCDNTAGDSITGLPIAGNVCIGRVVKFRKAEDKKKIRKGDIVAFNTIPDDFLDLLEITGGLILKSNVLLSHCALIAREWSIPCVGGINIDLLHENESYIVDGKNGTVVIADNMRG